MTVVGASTRAAILAVAPTAILRRHVLRRGGGVAWGLAMLALAATRITRWPTAAAISRVLLGSGIHLSYGLVLMAVPVA